MTDFCKPVLHPYFFHFTINVKNINIVLVYSFYFTN